MKPGTLVELTKSVRHTWYGERGPQRATIRKGTQGRVVEAGSNGVTVDFDRAGDRFVRKYVPLTSLRTAVFAGYYASVAKGVEDMTTEELLQELDGLASYVEACRKTGDGTSSKEVFRWNACYERVVRLMWSGS